jgi:hypothetical protein
MRAVALSATVARMGIRTWLSKMRKSEDDAAVRRAEDEMRSGSPEEREAISGDIEGLGADNRSERRAGEGSISDVDRLGGF